MTKPNEKLKTYSATKVNEYFHIETCEDDPNVYGKKFKFVEKSAFDELMKDAREMVTLAKLVYKIPPGFLPDRDNRTIDRLNNAVKAFDEKWNPEPKERK